VDHHARVVKLDGSARPSASTPAPVGEISTRDLELLFGRLSASLGNDFIAAKTLVGLVEAAAARMGELDRLQLGRLMVSSGHAVTLTCRRSC
jgi:hypothetical protein